MSRASGVLRRYVGPTLLALALWVSGGCGDDLAPTFSSFSVTPECGVARPQEPSGEVFFEVQCTARATGGNPMSDPTGANVPLEISWDFGDGTSTKGPSLVFHRYTAPGTYTVTVRVKDADGQSDERSAEVQVFSVDDALTSTLTLTSGPVERRNQDGDIIGYDATFAASVSRACPDDPGNPVQFLFDWDFGDGTPLVVGDAKLRTHRFPATAGTYTVTMTVTELDINISESQQLQVTVP